MSTTSDQQRTGPVLSATGIVVEYPRPTAKIDTLKELLLQRLKKQTRVEKHAALKGVSVVANRGECVVLIGHNGCGKSTMLKVIAGIITPQKGTLAVEGRLSPLIELGAGFDPELTGRENVFLSCSLLGLSRAEIRERLDEIRVFADIGEFFDAPVKTYSSGMYMRLGFACATAVEPDVLLIDEILAVGDENFQKKCLVRMQEVKAAGATIVLVTHDLEAARRMADRAIVLDHGEQIFEGEPLQAIEVYRELMEQARLAGLPEQQRAEEQRRRRLKKDWEKQLEAPVTAERAKIVKVSVADHTGKDVLSTDGRWQIGIDVNIEAVGAEPPVVGFAVHNHAGVRVFGGNTKVYATAQTNKGRTLLTQGRHRVTFDFERLGLATGQYTVVAAIHNAQLDATLDYMSVAGHFRVVCAADANNFDHDIVAGALLQPQLSID